MVRKLLVSLLLSLSVFPLHAQDEFDLVKNIRPFGNLDLSLTVATTGVGLDLATPLSKSVAIRTGFQFVPNIKPKMSFGIGLEDDDTADGSMGPVTKSRFEEMTDIFTQLTGCYIDDKVDMIGEFTFHNFTFLVDVSPFKDKRWHFTTGIYAGSSRIAKAYNTTEDMPSLFSVGLYNRLYDNAKAGDDNEFGIAPPLIVLPHDPDDPNDDQEIYLDPEVAAKLLEYGRMGINVGQMADGSKPYRMEPNGESMVKVRMKVNPVRPYLGFGFSDKFNKKNKNSKYSFAFDAGVLFWGGTPQIITHDGTDLAKDVVDIKGKAGDYVRFMKSFKVFPTISFKITRRLY